jgi:hypothetical protein
MAKTSALLVPATNILHSIFLATPYTELTIMGEQRMAQTRRMGMQNEGPSYQKRRGLPTAHSLRSPFPKYRRAHTNHRRTLCNCDPIVVAHAHRELRQRKTRLAR